MDSSWLLYTDLYCILVSPGRQSISRASYEVLIALSSANCGIVLEGPLC